MANSARPKGWLSFYRSNANRSRTPEKLSEFPSVSIGLPPHSIRVTLIPVDAQQVAGGLDARSDERVNYFCKRLNL